MSTPELTAILDEEAEGLPWGPALPFAPSEEEDESTAVLDSPLRDALEAARPDRFFDDQDDVPTLHDPSQPNPMAAAVDAFGADDGDELGRTQRLDELSGAAELDHVPRSQGAQPAGDETAPFPALSSDAAVFSAPPSSSEGPPSQRGLLESLFEPTHEGVDTIVGQPPAFLVRLQAITLDQYASMRAECDLFPARVDEVRQVVGLRDDTEHQALDELWRLRFGQSPTLRSQFEQALARYRVWLLHKGKA